MDFPEIFCIRFAKLKALHCGNFLSYGAERGRTKRLEGAYVH